MKLHILFLKGSSRKLNNRFFLDIFYNKLSQYFNILKNIRKRAVFLINTLNNTHIRALSKFI